MTCWNRFQTIVSISLTWTDTQVSQNIIKQKPRMFQQEIHNYLVIVHAWKSMSILLLKIDMPFLYTSIILWKKKQLFKQPKQLFMSKWQYMTPVYDSLHLVFIFNLNNIQRVLVHFEHLSNQYQNFLVAILLVDLPLLKPILL